eukprot:12913812-Prorocentrum_lima.AAC.1
MLYLDPFVTITNETIERGCGALVEHMQAPSARAFRNIAAVLNINISVSAAQNVGTNVRLEFIENAQT